MDATCHRRAVGVNIVSMTAPLKPASSVILRHEGKYLLVRRANPPAADMYAFPGGRAEAGETPPETALRELYEETGLTGVNPQLFATYELLGDDGGFFLSVFTADCDDVGVLLAQDDAAEAGWFAASEIGSIAVPQSVAECLQRLENLQN
jgi:8-oxo-dGTP diphosphatase